jgi:hypothetical protein
MPLQKRQRYTWEYKNAGDIMQIYPGLANNLTVMQHISLCHQLFRVSGKFRLPDKVMPLHINSAKDSILAMIPTCTARGVKADWELPSLEDEMTWASNLTERPTREEKDLIQATRDEELAYIAYKAEEALKAGKASDSRATATDEEEETPDEEVAEEHQEEPVREEVAGETEEGGDPQGPKKKVRILRKASSQ